MAAAREKRRVAKEALAQGIDPCAVAATDIAAGIDEAIPRGAPQEPQGFEAIARAWHANREEGLDPAHAGRVLRRLDRGALPALPWTSSKAFAGQKFPKDYYVDY